MVRRLAEQHGAQRGLGGEVEAVPHGFGEVAAGLGQAQHRAGRRVVGGEDVLTGAVVRAAVGRRTRGVVSGRIYGAQCLVTLRQVVQGQLERVAVERAVDAQDERDVVGGAGAFEAVEEPQPLLGRGEGEGTGAGHGGERYGGEGRAKRVRTSAARGAGGGVPEDVGDAHRHAEVLAEAGGQPRGEQRMPAEVEEARFGGRGFGDTEHVGEDPAHDLGVRPVVRPALTGSGEGERVGVGQGAVVELVVGGTGQRVQERDGRGDHVLGQGRGQVLAQLGGGGRGRVGPGRAVRSRRRVPLGPYGDGVGEQPLAVAGVAGDDGRRGDPGVGGQAGLDLPELDAEAADLDLVVATPEELQRVVRTAAHQVAGAVHPPPGVPVPRAEGVRDEPLRRQVGLKPR